MDAIGPMERRLLGLERRLVHVDEAVRQNRVHLVGLGQGIWDAWSDRRRPRGTPAPTPTPTPTGTFEDCCPGYVFPSTLTLSSNLWGNFTLTWDSSVTWSGCKQISFGGHGSCGAVSMPLWYWMVVNPTTCTAALNSSWYGDFAGCPASGHTCADSRPIALRTTTVSLGCSGDTMTWHNEEGSGPNWNGSGATQTITLP